MRAGDRPFIWAGDLHRVDGADNVDAVAGAVLGRIDNIQSQMCGHIGPRSGAGEQVARGVLHVRQPVHVELEHLRGVLNAQTVASAEVLIDPDQQGFVLGGRRVGHAHPFRSMESNVPQEPITTL